MPQIICSLALYRQVYLVYLFIYSILITQMIKAKNLIYIQVCFHCVQGYQSLVVFSADDKPYVKFQLPNPLKDMIWHNCVYEIIFKYVKLCLFFFSSGQGFPMQLHSSVEYNPLPSALAGQSYGGYNGNRSHTRSE